MAKVFRFEDRRAAEAEHRLVELRDGRVYRFRTQKAQTGGNAVRLGRLLTDLSTDAEDAPSIEGLLSAALRAICSEDIPDAALREATAPQSYGTNWPVTSPQPIIAPRLR